MWVDIGIAALLLVGVYCFLELVGFRSRVLTSKSDRRAEDMYDQYADSPRAQRRYASKRGGSEGGWGGGRGDEPGPPSRSVR